MSDPHHDPHGGGTPDAHPPEEATEVHDLHETAIPAEREGAQVLALGMLGVLVLLIIGGWFWKHNELWPYNPPTARYEPRVSTVEWTVKTVLCPKVLITNGEVDRLVDFPPAGYGPSSERLRLSRENRGSLLDANAFCRKYIRPDPTDDRREPRRWTVRFEIEDSGSETGNYEFFPPVDDIDKANGIAEPKPEPPPPPPAPEPKVEPPPVATSPTVN